MEKRGFSQGDRDYFDYMSSVNKLERESRQAKHNRRPDVVIGRGLSKLRPIIIEVLADAAVKAKFRRTKIKNNKQRRRVEEARRLERDVFHRENGTLAIWKPSAEKQSNSPTIHIPRKTVRAIAMVLVVAVVFGMGARIVSLRKEVVALEATTTIYVNEDYPTEDVIPEEAIVEESTEEAPVEVSEPAIVEETVTVLETTTTAPQPTTTAPPPETTTTSTTQATTTEATTKATTTASTTQTTTTVATTTKATTVATKPQVAESTPVQTVSEDTPVQNAKSESTSDAAHVYNPDRASKYYIVVYTGDQTVLIHEKDENGMYSRLVKAFRCSTGGEGHSTRLDTYSVIRRFRWRALVGGVWGQYSTSFSDDYLFHSVPYLKENDPASLDMAEYDKLGTPASKGCVRLCVRDAKWIYDNVPDGTQVNIVDDTCSTQGAEIPKRNGDKKYNGWDPSDPDEKNPYLQSSGAPDGTIKSGTVYSVSDEIIGFICAYEGRKSEEPYRCEANCWTIGYGHAYTSSESKKWSKERAITEFNKDIEEALGADKKITKQHPRLTDAEAKALLKWDLEHGPYKKNLDEFIKDKKLILEQRHYDALLSFAYNCGQSVWTRKTCSFRDYLVSTKDLRNCNARRIQHLLGQWVHASGKVQNGLVRRRMNEAMIFNSGSYRILKLKEAKKAWNATK